MDGVSVGASNRKMRAIRRFSKEREDNISMAYQPQFPYIITFFLPFLKYYSYSLLRTQ